MGPVRQNPIQRTVSLFICVCIALCTIVAHNIAQDRPDSFPPYPPDNHHISDDVYLREGGWTAYKLITFGIYIHIYIYNCTDICKVKTHQITKCRPTTIFLSWFSVHLMPNQLCESTEGNCSPANTSFKPQGCGHYSTNGCYIPTAFGRVQI